MTYIALSFLFILLSFASASASACERCLHRSKATHTDQWFRSGSCGYGPLAPNFNGLLAAGNQKIYKGGAGCGACFEVRCTHPRLCKRQGTRVIIADSHGDYSRDFVLSKKAMVALANYGKSQALLNLGDIDVEYKRVPCDFQNRNLAIRVEEASNKPYYLAIKILYQGGQTEILAVDVAPVNSWNKWKWMPMRRTYGAVWDLQEKVSGPLKFRFLVKSDFNTKNYQTQSVLPANWRKGVIYDAGIQFKDVAYEKCPRCDFSNW